VSYAEVEIYVDEEKLKVVCHQKKID